MSLAHDILARAVSSLPVGAGRRLDSWVSAITGLGGLRDKTRSARVAGFVPLTLYELDALYHGDDLAAKIVSALPEEAMRLGWETDSEELDRALDRWQVAQLFLDAWIWGRLYGRGAILIGTADRLGAMHEPLDVSQIGKGDLAFLYVLDGQDLTVADWFTDAGNKNYGDPRTYFVNVQHNAHGGDSRGLASGQRVHASRLIMFGGARTSERQRLRNQGRDLSVLQVCNDVLRDVDQTWRSVMCLMQDLSQAVFKGKGLIPIVAEGRSDVLMDRMQIVDMARSVARAVVVDADDESFEHTGAQNVTGVDPLLIRTFTRLAAAADIPLTVLMGVSPAGLNATGESDIRIWYAKAEKAQRLVAPQARRLSYIIAKAEGLEWCDKDISWPSLWSATEKEKAELEKLQADTDNVRVQSSVLTADEAFLVRFADVDPVEFVRTRQEAVDPSGEVPDTGPEIHPGEVWIDTHDGHRIRVNKVTSGDVYASDLDSINPDLQFRWRVATFLERCTLPGAPQPAAPAPEPTPAPPAPAPEPGTAPAPEVP